MLFFFFYCLDYKMAASDIGTDALFFGCRIADRSSKLQIFEFQNPAQDCRVRKWQLYNG